MKNHSRLSIVLVSALLLLVTFSSTYARELVPNSDGLLYYKLGGGRGHQLPPVEDTTRIPVDVKGVTGLGYSCGLFTPAAAITDSIRNIKDSVENIDKKLVKHATGLVMAMPMYLAARADSTFAQSLRNFIFGAKEDFTLSFKSCEQMESDALNGDPVFDNVVKVAMGNRWKKEIGYARSSKTANINKAKSDVVEDRGRSGIPWLGGKNAGGSPKQGQAPIHVVADTTKAGYNILLNRDVTQDRPAPTKSNQHLSRIWKTPKEASEWVVNVVGDIKMSSCSDEDCEKGTEPGKGLILFTEAINQDIYKHLSELVIGDKPVTQEALDQLAMPGLAMMEDVIIAIRNQSPVNQAIWVDNLSSSMSSRHAVDYAMLAQRLLRVGRQIPEIANNSAVDDYVQRAIKNLSEEIDLIIDEHQRRKNLVVDTIEGLLQFDEDERQRALAREQYEHDTQPIIRDGAIPKPKSDR